jgi:hypothetical protein
VALDASGDGTSESPITLPEDRQFSNDQFRANFMQPGARILRRSPPMAGRRDSSRRCAGLGQPGLRLAQRPGGLIYCLCRRLWFLFAEEEIKA